MSHGFRVCQATGISVPPVPTPGGRDAGGTCTSSAQGLVGGTPHVSTGPTPQQGVRGT